MDSFEINKIAGAVLFTILIAMGLATAADLIFTSHAPEKPGYIIEVADVANSGEAAAEEAVQPTIAELMVNASAEAGMKLQRQCTACHTFEEGGASRVGPNLYNVVGRKIGAIDGFGYSDVLAQYGADGQTWSYEALNQFLRKPKEFAPGTKMNFKGYKDDKRADMIAYLKSLSPDAPPVPTE